MSELWYVVLLLLSVVAGIVIGNLISASGTARPGAPNPSRWNRHYFMLESPGRSVCLNMRQVAHYQFSLIPADRRVGEPERINLTFHFYHGAPTVSADMTHAEACDIYRTLTGSEPPALLRAPEVAAAPIPAEIVTGAASPQPFPDTYQRKGPLP